MKEAPKHDGPRSVCSCGHTGDGPKSEHKDTFTPGHGACKVRGCNCVRFTWVEFLSVFQDKLDREK
jgi:hypothetical protein